MHGERAVRPANSDFTAFFDALDALDQRLAFTNCAGSILFATAAMQRLLDEVPGLETELAAFSVEVCERSAHGRWHSIAPRVDMREITHSGARYVIQGSHIGYDFLGSGPSVLFTLQAVPTDPLDPDRLSRRFPLTPQECRVARLLGLGLSNQQIGAELGISTHTARHHMQRIVQKLHASSRAALISLLLRDDAEP